MFSDTVLRSSLALSFHHVLRLDFYVEFLVYIMRRLLHVLPYRGTWVNHATVCRNTQTWLLVTALLSVHSNYFLWGTNIVLSSWFYYERSWSFYALLTLHPSIIFVNKPNYRTNFSCMFISILYMFRATMCPSSGELTVSMRYLVYVTLKQGNSLKLREVMP